MPVSFNLTPHPATKVEVHRDAYDMTAERMLDYSCPAIYEDHFGAMFQSSFGAGGSLVRRKQSEPVSDTPNTVPVIERAPDSGSPRAARVTPHDVPQSVADVILGSRNGLVDTVIHAYNEHHALVLRPDDIWLAILVQFSMFIGRKDNAERLRRRFVAHEGQINLSVSDDCGNRYHMKIDRMADQMTNLMDEHIVDPELRTWILPSFSTTTTTDGTVARILMMATMKHYFTFEFIAKCGIPRITLLGNRGDWQDILKRAECIGSYGEDAALWHSLLRPVLVRFVRTFDDPTLGEDLRFFWERMVHYEDRHSGSARISGWITAFCVFDEEGHLRSGLRRIPCLCCPGWPYCRVRRRWMDGWMDDVQF